MNRILVEVCVDSIDDALAAVAAGADRLELNAALSLGGLTPSTGLLAEVRRHVGGMFPLVVMIRPRAGGFCYSAAERDVMRRDIDTMLEQGASGIACGILTNEGKIDQAACVDLFAPVLSSTAASEGVVFHRAFDYIPDALAGLETLVDLGVRRVLTSGLEASAWEGVETIAKLATQARGRIEILPGGGIRPENACQIVAIAQVDQVHGSFREVCRDHGDSSLAGRPELVLGAGMDGGQKTKISPARIVATIEQLRHLRL